MSMFETELDTLLNFQPETMYVLLPEHARVIEKALSDCIRLRIKSGESLAGVHQGLTVALRGMFTVIADDLERRPSGKATINVGWEKKVE